MSSFNRGARIGRAIRSVMEQTFDDWELIVVDDASAEDSRSAIRELARVDDRIKPIFRNTNFGTDTRPKNQGTEAARADHVAYLDDDNAFRPDHLSALWTAMEETGAEVVYGDRLIIWEDGSHPPVPASRDFDACVLMLRNYIDTSDVLCRKDAVLSIGGWDETLPFLVDWNLWVRMWRNGARFVRRPGVITDYYIHGGNQVLTLHALGKEKLAAWIRCHIQECPIVARHRDEPRPRGIDR